MKTGEIFPLPWERLLWSAAPAFPEALRRPGVRYAFTDFRLVVRRRGRTIRELALTDIGDITIGRSWWQNAAGTSTVRVRHRRGGTGIELTNIHHGPDLALMLRLRASDLSGEDAGSIDVDVPGPAPAPGGPASMLRSRRALALAATLMFALLSGVIGLARHTALPPVAYAADDALAPNGQRRPAEDIAAFMEREVMPFARRVLGPVVGGADHVTCETCHGEDARFRGWRMPGVRALPEPDVRDASLERALWLDPQLRNAVFGYLAGEDKQSIASYMRQVVMPGMAALMHRPAYDFARSYGYNRSRAAVGCYHCHLVE